MYSEFQHFFTKQERKASFGPFTDPCSGVRLTFALLLTLTDAMHQCSTRIKPRKTALPVFFLQGKLVAHQMANKSKCKVSTRGLACPNVPCVCDLLVKFHCAQWDFYGHVMQCVTITEMMQCNKWKPLVVSYSVHTKCNSSSTVQIMENVPFFALRGCAAMRPVCVGRDTRRYC